MTLRRYLVPRSVFSARIEHRCPAGSVKCQHLIPFWRPSWDLHAGRTHRHPKDGDARDGRAIAQEPIDDVGRHMSLDDVIRDERRVAGSQGGGDAKATAEWCEILDVLRRNRVPVVAQVSHPRAATPSGRRPVDSDVRLGARGCAGPSRIAESHRQRAEHRGCAKEPQGRVSLRRFPGLQARKDRRDKQRAHGARRDSTWCRWEESHRLTRIRNPGSRSTCSGARRGQDRGN